MSQAAEVSTEPLKWPIAPDGYIPNSVIRSWRRRKGKEFTKMDKCNDTFFYSLYQVDECTTNNQEDMSSRVFLFLQDEEEVKEETDDVKSRMKEKQNEKNKKDNVEKTEVGRKERVGERKEIGGKWSKTSLVKQSYNIHNETSLQTHQEICENGNMKVEPQELSLTYSSTKAATPASSHGNEKEPLRELKVDMKLPESITHPPQYVSASVPNKQTTSGISSEEWVKPPKESPVISADNLIPKQDPKITTHVSPVESKNLTPHSLKSPPATPEDLQPQTNLEFSDCSAIRDKGNNNIEDQEHMYPHRKVSKLYKKELSLTYSSTKAATPASSHGNEKEPLRELKVDMKLPESISHPPQCVSASVPNKQTTSGISSDGDWGTEDLQPQTNLRFSDCSAIRDNENNNIEDHEHMYLDRKVFKLYKKLKDRNKDSHLRKLSTTAERPPVSEATHTTIQTKTGGVNLEGGLGSPSEFRATLSNVNCPNTNPECSTHQIWSEYPAQFIQNILQTERHKSMPEWRRNLYKLISVHGFRSPWAAARLATTEYPVRPSNARKLAATIPSLQAGQTASHQRVVQKIQMKDTLEPVFCQFHHVIPMASQHSFFALNPCKTAQYGRLQYDWAREFEEDNPLIVSAVKIHDSAHKVVSKTKTFNHWNRSG